MLELDLIDRGKVDREKGVPHFATTNVNEQVAGLEGALALRLHSCYHSWRFRGCLDDSVEWPLARALGVNSWRAPIEDALSCHVILTHRSH